MFQILSEENVFVTWQEVGTKRSRRPWKPSEINKTSVYVQNKSMFGQKTVKWRIDWDTVSLEVLIFSR